MENRSFNADIQGGIDVHCSCKLVTSSVSLEMRIFNSDRFWKREWTEPPVPGWLYFQWILYFAVSDRSSQRHSILQRRTRHDSFPLSRWPSSVSWHFQLRPLLDRWPYFWQWLNHGSPIVEQLKIIRRQSTEHDRWRSDSSEPESVQCLWHRFQPQIVYFTIAWTTGAQWYWKRSSLDLHWQPAAWFAAMLLSVMIRWAPFMYNPPPVVAATLFSKALCRISILGWCPWLLMSMSDAGEWKSTATPCFPLLSLNLHDPINNSWQSTETKKIKVA